MTTEQIVSGAIVSIFVALVGWLTARSSNKASMTNVVTSSRVEMEKEAYERARKLDTDTIARQEKEHHELAVKYDALDRKYETVRAQNLQMSEDMSRIARDNYEVHTENRRVLEMNSQIIAENNRIRNQGEVVIQDNHRLRQELSSLRIRVTKVQRGIDPNSDEIIEERETDTAPMFLSEDQRHD